VRDAARRGDVDYLIDALADPEARGSAALRLGDLGERRAVPALTRNLHIRNDIDRNLAAKALGKIGDPSAITGLLEVATEDEAAGVRTTAIDSLVKLGSPDGAEMLAQLAVDPSPVLATCSRYFDAPTARELRPDRLRQTRKWAAKRLRELHVTAAAPALRAALPTVNRRHRMLLRRTIRSLQD
jgi:HEAT repeat protein